MDIPNIFRDFDADPDDPEAYDFAFTDLLIKALVENGVEPFFRLGVTIENQATATDGTNSYESRWVSNYTEEIPQTETVTQNVPFARKVTPKLKQKNGCAGKEADRASKEADRSICFCSSSVSFCF